MFYNERTNELLAVCPGSGLLADGTLVQGLDIADAETRRACGILPVKSDTPPQPAGTVEDMAARSVTVAQDGVAVVRTWVPEPTHVPASVSPRQIRLWIVGNGISLAAIDTAIEGIADPVLREQTRIEWEFSPYVERSHPMVATLGAALGMTSEQIDQAFIAAAGL